MKTTIKLAAISALALAAASTSAFANSELPAGATTGLALGAPLPEGVYAISQASYGSSASNNLAYAIPVWLIWSTPYQIAGGRIAIDTATAVADSWKGVVDDSFLNTLVEGSIAWNLGGGWNASLRAGAWLPSTQSVAVALGRDYTAFQGGGSLSYVANGWNLTATALYGSGGNHKTVANGYLAEQNPWVNLDLTATKKLGKMEIGAVAYGSWDEGCVTSGCKKSSEFAMGGLVGYDFGAFIAQAKLTGDVQSDHTTLNGNDKEVRGTLTIIKPLWSPAAEGPLK